MIVRRDKLAKYQKSSMKQHESCGPARGETTFRHDFQPPDTMQCYRKSILPPEPARISISSPNSPVNTEMYQSAMKASYEKPNCRTRHQVSTYDRQRIYNTNFKTGVDNSFNGFCTSNQLEYTHRVTVPASTAHNYANSLSVLKLANPGPLGNKNLRQCPKPEYLDSYQDIPAGSHQQLLVKKNHNEDHMKDARSNIVEPYQTTSMETFRGPTKAEDNPLPLSASLQQKRITSIAFGDKNKVNETSSISQQTYRKPCSSTGCSNGVKYSKQSAHSLTHQSSINLGNVTDISDMSSTLLPLYGNIKKPQAVVYERNASSFPAGDLNNDRVKDRLSNLTRMIYSKPPPGSFPSHVDSSYLHTLSHVHLGSEVRIPTHQTTMRKSYHPLSLNGVKHVRAPLKDDIPFNYPNSVLTSTVKDSFGRKDPSEIDKPNNMTSKYLKKSHWQLPNMGIPEFSTIHQESFTLPAPCN